MKARCLTSFFTEKVSGTQGQTITINDQKTLDDLVQCGYVEEIQSNQTSPETVAMENDVVDKKTTAKTKKANEGK
jgi:hypothetical protein